MRLLHKLHPIRSLPILIFLGFLYQPIHAQKVAFQKTGYSNDWQGIENDQIPIYRWYGSDVSGWVDVQYSDDMDLEMRKQGFTKRKYLFTGFKANKRGREALYLWKSADGNYTLSMTQTDAFEYLANGQWEIEGEPICYVETRDCIGCTDIYLLSEQNPVSYKERRLYFRKAWDEIKRLVVSALP